MTTNAPAIIIVNGRRDDFLRPLQIVGNVVSKSTQLPILQNVLIRKEGATLSLQSSDTQMQITTASQIGVGDDVAVTTVAARKLGDIVRALPEGGQLKLSLSDKRLQVQCGKSRFVLQVLPADQFPVMKTPEQWDATVQLPQKVLRRLIEDVHIAMAQQDIRYFLNGMLLHIEEKRIAAVATDGHRLAYAHVDLDEPLESRQHILPSKAVLELKRQLEPNDELVTLQFSGSQLRCDFGCTVFDLLLVEGSFPAYGRVIPKDNVNTLVVGRTDLIESFKRAALLADEKSRAVRCSVSEGVLRLTGTNPTDEEAVEEMEVEYAGAPIELGVNVQYVLAALENLEGDKVCVALKDGSSSILLTLPEREDVKHVIMPLRI